MKQSTKGFGMLIVFISVAIILFTVIGFSLVSSKKISNFENETRVEESVNDIVDDLSFETAKPISTDNSILTIEKELDDTIILEEDLSDL